MGIRHSHIPHNAPYLRPNILYNFRFSFLLGITAVPREIENNTYSKSWWANRVHYGKSGSGVCADTEKSTIFLNRRKIYSRLAT